MGKSTAGSIQPLENVAGNISYFCHVSFYTPNHVFQNFVALPAVLPFLMILFSADQIMNLIHLFISQPAQCDLGIVREKVSL